jgi:hypothetical protein
MITQWASSQFVPRVGTFLDEPVLNITLARTVKTCTKRKTRKQTRKHQACQQTKTPTVLTAAHTMICGPDKTP